MSSTEFIEGRALWETYLLTGRDVDLPEEERLAADAWLTEHGVDTVEYVEGAPFDGVADDGTTVLMCLYFCTSWVA